MYPIQVVRKLVQYLEDQADNPITDADVYINKRAYFRNHTGVIRRQVEPSMVNHIGYYSERMRKRTDRGIFSQLNTDVRFVLDGP